MDQDTPRPALPALDWSITLPETLDFHDKYNPNLPLFVYYRDEMDHITDITYARFVSAARIVPQLLGISSDEVKARPVVAIVANTDTLIYHTIVLGLMLAGAVPFPISPRNTPEAIMHLMKRSKSHHLVITSATLPEVKDSVLNGPASDPAWTLRMLEAPVLTHLYLKHASVPGVAHTTLTRKPLEANKPNLDDIALYLHSSGSTGLPKPIPRTHREIVNYMKFPTTTIYRQSPRLILASMELPPFHAMAFVLQIGVPFFHGGCCALFPPQVKTHEASPITPNPDNVIHYIERTQTNGCFTVPTFLNVWSNDRRAIGVLQKLNFVAFGGGAPGPAGEKLFSDGIKLRSVYGGTEFGAVGISSPRPGDEADWEYLDVMGEDNPVFVDQGDGTYELQFISLDNHPRSVCNIPGVKGYATSDLFTPHPTKHYLWKHVGRIDDTIVHSSGEKTVPAAIESILMRSQYVSGVVLFGTGRDMPGVLIELRPEYDINVCDPKEVAGMRDRIWPVVREANHHAPAFSKIYKELIVFTSTSKPLPRTPKGTVPRNGAWRLYANEIEAAYTDIVYALPGGGDIAFPEPWSQHNVATWLLNKVQVLCPGTDVTPDKNLFEQGLDSLSAAILRRRIMKSLARVEGDNAQNNLSMTETTIYAHPTVNALAAYLTTTRTDDTTANELPRTDVMDHMIAKYAVSKSTIGTSNRLETTSRNVVVIVTGSTGSLGSHVLEGFLRDANVTKIFALNRPHQVSPSAARHLMRFKDRGLDVKLLNSEKLVHLESDYSLDNLGLSEERYEELRGSVNVIIHLAWPLNFNMTTDFFEPNIRGTHNLVAFARSSLHAENIRFIFASSIGVAQSWDMSRGPYPEALVMESKYAVGTGYGEAKYVSERILASSGLNSISVRIGQMCGSPVNGAWATSDWVPILVKSSVALGVLPSARGNISWLGPDSVSNVVLELATPPQKFDSEALNLLHPNPISWDSMIQKLRRALQVECGISLIVVPYQEWFSLLDESFTEKNGTSEAERIPAIKLYDFFHQLAKGDLENSQHTTEAFGIPELSTGRTKGLPPSVTNLAPISQNQINNWVKYWEMEGLFSTL